MADSEPVYFDIIIKSGKHYDIKQAFEDAGISYRPLDVATRFYVPHKTYGPELQDIIDIVFSTDIRAHIELEHTA